MKYVRLITPETVLAAALAAGLLAAAFTESKAQSVEGFDQRWCGQAKIELMEVRRSLSPVYQLGGPMTPRDSIKLVYMKRLRKTLAKHCK